MSGRNSSLRRSARVVIAELRARRGKHGRAPRVNAGFERRRVVVNARSERKRVTVAIREQPARSISLSIRVIPIVLRREKPRGYPLTSVTAWPNGARKIESASNSLPFSSSLVTLETPRPRIRVRVIVCVNAIRKSHPRSVIPRSRARPLRKWTHAHISRRFPRKRLTHLLSCLPACARAPSGGNGNANGLERFASAVKGRSFDHNRE